MSTDLPIALPTSAKHSNPIAQKSGELFTIRLEETTHSNYVVDFSGPDDLSNPINWPLWYKWILIIVLSSVNTIA